jgi:ferredoxin
MPLMITEGCILCDACIPVCPSSGIRKGESVYVIDQEACTECVGFFGSQQCAQVCPMDCCIPNPRIVLSEEALFERAQANHASSDEQLALTADTSHFRRAATGSWWSRLFSSPCVDG